jgi:formylglycine-generating enzyme required for sulfatase activity/sugar lactone lactonase YvrE
MGLAIDAAKNVYVGDYGNNTIRKITSAGVVTNLAGFAGGVGSTDGTASAARFNQPNGIAVDSAGNVYVADMGNHTIRKITAVGVVTTLAGFPGGSGSVNGTGSAARFNQPFGIAADSAGNVYVADYANHTIRKITSGGVVTTLAGAAGSEGSADGIGSAARFTNPAGVAVDNAGIIYVADASNGTIRKVTSSGVVTTVAGAPRSVPAWLDGIGSTARFSVPWCIAVDSSGTLYVTEQGNNTVRKITIGGVVTTIAGVAGGAGSANGTGSVARFAWPRGVAVDRSGVVFVADELNSTIRRGTPAVAAGFVTVPAGPFSMGAPDYTARSVSVNEFLISPVEVTVAVWADFRAKAQLRGYTTIGSGQAGSGGQDLLLPVVNVSGYDRLAWCNARSEEEGLTPCYYEYVATQSKGRGAVYRNQGMVTVMCDFSANGYRLPTGAEWEKAARGGLVDANFPWGNVSASAALANWVYATGYPMQLTLPGFYLANGFGLYDVAGNVYELTWDVQDQGLPATGAINPRFDGAVTSDTVLASRGGAWNAGYAPRCSYRNPGVSLSYSEEQSGFRLVRNSLSIPVVNAQPGALTQVVGATATLSLTASGAAPLTYQWRKDATPVAGATNASLSLASVQLSDAGSYDVVVTNASGTVTSNPAALTVAVPAPPAITRQPEGNTIYVGGRSSFFVDVSSTVTVTYQWRFNGAQISGAISSSYSISNAQLTHAGAYDVVVASVAGTAISQAAGLVVVTPTPPSIITQPVSLTQFVGGPVTLSVTAFGGPPPGYQWRKDGVSIFGATNSNYFLASVAEAHVGYYDVIVTNAAGSITSSAVALTVTPPVAPTITSQPVGGTLYANNIGSFRVTASGSAPLAYQWRKNGVAVVGAVSSSFILGSVTPASAGTYDVVVSNAAGSVASTSVALFVVANPGFVLHPVSQAVGLGGAVQLTANAIGDFPLVYQWRKNSVPLGGATTSSLSLINFQSSDLAAYDVIVTNSVGSATSSAGVLALAAGAIGLPVITSQPAGATLDLNNQGSFLVTATSTNPLFYQWRKNGTAIAGATNSVLGLGAVTATSAGSFDVVVTNLAGPVTSTAVALTVNPPVVFNSQPLSVSTFVGLGVTFSASATGFPGAPTYQWRKDTVVITGATSSSFTLAAAQLADAGSYDVIATASAGSATSNAATLSVTNSAPQITAQPAGATLAVGGNATLSVAATGAAPLTYQWRRDGVSILGSTLAALSIANAQTYQAGVYDVVVTNSVGSATSVGARLNVIPRVVAYSARLLIDNDGAVAVFTIEGTLPKKVLLRAIGPGLAPFGFSGLPDPQLELFSSTGTLLAINNDWASSADAAAITTTTSAVGAFALTIGSRDSAVLATLPPGTYTVRAKPASGVGGTGYIELYDADLATGPLSTLPYVAVRGRMGAGGGVVIGGLGSNGRGQRSYLVRAIGPKLGLPGAHANPAMLVVRDGTLVGSNDDWDATATEAAATTAATTRVATFSLPAGGRDSALVLTGNLHAGACTVQVGGSDALGGTVLLELHDLDAVRPVTFAPAIASAPVSTTVANGAAATLRVLAQGTAPLTYQWRKDGIPLGGATTATLSLAAVQASQGGSYTVLVSNALGAATSLSAVLTVQSGGSGSAATQAVVGSGYAAGATATITNTLTYTAAATGLGWKVTLPLGWSFVSAAGMLGDVRPVVGTVGALEWAWSVPPVGPVTFTYTVSVPAGTAGDQFLAASGIVRFDGALSQPIATPSPLLVPQITMHSADTNADYRISLVELTRVIELYNTRLGTTRTGRYLIQDGSEDGYGIDRVTPAGAPVTITRFHSADSNRNAEMSLLELTRVIELYNVRSGSSRTGAYRLQADTEDGFAPGPGVIAYTSP